MQNSTQRTEKGFTLIELLIAMALALVVITSLASSFISQRKTYDVQEQISEMTQNARAAMDMMSGEIRMAGYNPTGLMQTSNPAASNFVGIPYDTNQIKIIADLNGDGDASDSNENIIYLFDATNHRIDRNTGGGDQPFSENIKSFSFSYWDGDGTEITSSAGQADIRMIKITIEAKTEKEDPNYTHPDYNDGYRSFELTSNIISPNLGF